MKPDALRRYDLNLLVTLYVLLDECSVSRAAERLCLSQSAMSRSLGRLRDIFDDELFIRRPHGLQPTARATQLQVELADALSMVSRVVAPPEFNPFTCSKDFTISIMEHIAIQLMPRLLVKLREIAPLVKVRVHPWSRRSLSEMTTGKLDMAINILPLSRPDLHRRVIAPVLAEVLMAGGHPLAGIDRLTQSQYLSYPHVSLNIAEYAEKPFASKISTLLDNRDIMLLTSDPHLAFEVVSQTDALMIGTTSFTSMLRERYQLQASAIPQELSVLQSDYQLTWHRLMDRDPAHGWFRNLIYEECRQLLLEENQTLLPVEASPEEVALGEVSLTEISHTQAALGEDTRVVPRPSETPASHHSA